LGNFHGKKKGKGKLRQPALSLDKKQKEKNAKKFLRNEERKRSIENESDGWMQVEVRW
jgi:predicted nucleic acid-binding protein